MFRRLLLYSLPLRGGKKGKGKGEEVKIEATTDIINIFKEGKDPERLPKSEYPSWLFELTESYQTHPVHFAEDMYSGKQGQFKYIELKRLWKYAKRTRICEVNKQNPNMKQMKKDEITDEIPGAEDTDIDPDDGMVPIIRIALGAPPKEIIQESLLRIRQELGLIKKNP